MLGAAIQGPVSTGIVCSVEELDTKPPDDWRLTRGTVLEGAKSNLLALARAKNTFVSESEEMIRCCQSKTCTTAKLQEHFSVLEKPVQNTSRIKSMEIALDLFLLLTKTSTEPTVKAKHIMIKEAKEMMAGVNMLDTEKILFYERIVPLISSVSSKSSLREL